MNNETFIYMGGDMVVPQDIVRVRVHPSVTVIPEKAFHQHEKLEEVELCEGLLEIREWSFSGDWGDVSALKRIRIPSSVRVIGSNAFFHCKKLEDVELSEGLLEIGSHAFDGCKALKRINIPSSVTHIRDNAFAWCGQLEDIELSEGLLEIGEFAFIECTSLTRIRIPSTISVINTGAFKFCESLEEVDFCEELVEIGEMAFSFCYLINCIVFPSNLKAIGGRAFAHVPLTSLLLPADVESIGDHAFWSWYGSFTIARIPPTVTTITGRMCSSRSMFSIELPESIEQIDDEAFKSSVMLRNLAIPTNAEIGINVFKDCEDLKQLGPEIINVLKHRFDNLPIHKMLYYHSYGRGRIMRSMLDDPSFKLQDCLGMTPLHILACSTMHNIELYKILIEKHPGSLITKDRWGALPLLYAIWGDAGSDIVDLLVQSYQSIFPNYELDWTTMMDTFARANIPKKVFVCFSSSVRKHLNQNQLIDWNALVETAITLSVSDGHHIYINKETYRYLVFRSIRRRLKVMQKCTKLVNVMLDTIRSDVVDSIQGRRDFAKHVRQKLEVCQDKYNSMIEGTTMIELALWKNKMDDYCGQQKKTRRSKKLRMDDTAMRNQCRLGCGAETNIVIKHVLPYLDIL